jgi:DNA polymerase-3 subunit gamma/tau
MAYQVLYRTYRPKNFNTIVGLDTIVKVLRNQIKNNQVGHAYIFAGPRGTGKTSMAKIFAKAINCSAPFEDKPCGKCDNCIAIENGSSLDVVEIDAASNNGVDEIRNLRDGIKYLPTSSYKVYIIDEFHMLTTQAFNALLKTLEEPPKNVVFILATTELHKVPATILSRCQKFTFTNIDASSVVGKLEYIAKLEGIKYESGVLELIAKISEGGLRDAISLLDQSLSMSDGDVTIDTINLITGGVKEAIIASLFDSIIASDVVSLVKIFDSEIDNGKDIIRLLSDLLLYIKDVLVGIVAKKPKYLKYDYQKLAIMSSKIAEIMNLVKFSNQRRILVSMELINLSFSLQDKSTQVFVKAEEKPIKKALKKTLIKITSQDINNVISVATKQLREESSQIIESNFASSLVPLEKSFSKLSIGAISQDCAIFVSNNAPDANYFMSCEVKNEIIPKLDKLGVKINNYYIVTYDEWDKVTQIVRQQKSTGIEVVILPEINFSCQYELDAKSIESNTKKGQEIFGSDLIIDKGE